MGGHEAAVDEEADLAGVPLDPVAVLGADQPAGDRVLIAADPVFVRANSWLSVLLVLKIAQTLLKLSENPTCSNGAAPKVAVNSSERPEP